MSQYDFGTIDPLVNDGTQLATMLNTWRDAIHSWHRGASRPSYIVPGMIWINDTGGATNWVVNVYLSVGAGDKPLFAYNTTTGAITMTAAVVGAFLPLAGGSLSGNLTAAASQISAAILLSSVAGSPSVRWSATGNGVDLKNWRATIDGTAALRIAAFSDANVEQQAIVFGRDGRVSQSPFFRQDSWNMTNSANLAVPTNSNQPVFQTSATPSFINNTGAAVSHNASTGVFTILKDGTYNLNVLSYMELASGTGTLACQLLLTRSAAVLYDFRQSIAATFAANFQISQVVECLANDQIAIRVGNNSGVTATAYAISAGQLSGGHLQHFSGHPVT